MRIDIAKEAFNRILSLLASKLNIEIKRKKKISCYVWSIAQRLRKTGAEVFGKLRYVVLDENGEDKMVRESD